MRVERRPRSVWVMLGGRPMAVHEVGFDEHDWHEG